MPWPVEAAGPPIAWTDMSSTTRRTFRMGCWLATWMRMRLRMTLPKGMAQAQPAMMEPMDVGDGAGTGGDREETDGAPEKEAAPPPPGEPEAAPREGRRALRA